MVERQLIFTVGRSHTKHCKYSIVLLRQLRRQKTLAKLSNKINIRNVMLSYLHCTFRKCSKLFFWLSVCKIVFSSFCAHGGDKQWCSLCGFFTTFPDNHLIVLKKLKKHNPHLTLLCAQKLLRKAAFCGRP